MCQASSAPLPPPGTGQGGGGSSFDGDLQCWTVSRALRPSVRRLRRRHRSPQCARAQLTPLRRSELAPARARVRHSRRGIECGFSPPAARSGCSCEVVSGAPRNMFDLYPLQAAMGGPGFEGIPVSCRPSLSRPLRAACAAPADTLAGTPTSALARLLPHAAHSRSLYRCSLQTGCLCEAFRKYPTYGECQKAPQPGRQPANLLDGRHH